MNDADTMSPEEFERRKAEILGGESLEDLLDCLAAEKVANDAEWAHIMKHGKTSAEVNQEEAELEAKIEAVNNWKASDEDHSYAMKTLGKWLQEAPMTLADALSADDNLKSLKEWRHKAKEVADLGKVPGADEIFPVEAAMYLLDPRYGQKGRAEARFAIIENDKKRIIEEIIPQLDEKTRLAFLQDALPFICFPVLQAVPAALITLRDVSAARHLDTLPTKAYETLPKHVQFCVCANSESRCRRTVAKHMDSWMQTSGPSLDAALRSRRPLPSAGRRDEHMTQLAELASSHDALLFDRVLQIISEAFFAAEKKKNKDNNQWSLWPTLVTDFILALKPDLKHVSANALRRVALIADGALSAGKWDEAMLLKMNTTIARGELALQPSVAPENNRGIKRALPAAVTHQDQQPPRTKVSKLSPVEEHLDQRLEKIWHSLARADPQGIFAHPVTDEIAPGYSRIIKEPMDLGTMRSKIGRYESAHDFEIDLKKIVDNCKRFNGSGPLSSQASKLWKIWLKAKQSLLIGSTAVESVHRVSKKLHMIPEPASSLSAVSASTRSTNDNGLFRLGCRVLLAEPFAEVLALKGIVEEIAHAVHASQLPAQRKRCRDLVAYINLAASARTGQKSNLDSDLHLHLPRLQLALVEAKGRQERKSRKKHAARPNLLAALTENDETVAADDNKHTNEDQLDPLQPVTDLMTQISLTHTEKIAVSITQHASISSPQLEPEENIKKQAAPSSHESYGLVLTRLVSLSGSAADWFSTSSSGGLA